MSATVSDLGPLRERENVEGGIPSASGTKDTAASRASSRSLSGPLMHEASAVCQVRYTSEAERNEARRATWRRSAKRRYYEYRAFCRLYDIRPARQQWTHHCAELRQRPEWQTLRDFSRQEAFRYWLDNFSRDEILEIGSGLTMVDVQEVAA